MTPETRFVLVSNEDFFAENNHTPITFLKVRSSWGQNGSTSNLSGYKYSNALITNAAGYPVSYTHLLLNLIRLGGTAQETAHFLTVLQLGFDKRQQVAVSYTHLIPSPMNCFTGLDG